MWDGMAAGKKFLEWQVELETNVAHHMCKVFIIDFRMLIEIKMNPFRCHGRCM